MRACFQYNLTFLEKHRGLSSEHDTLTSHNATSFRRDAQDIAHVQHRRRSFKRQQRSPHELRTRSAHQHHPPYQLLRATLCAPGSRGRHGRPRAFGILPSTHLLHRRHHCTSSRGNAPVDAHERGGSEGARPERTAGRSCRRSARPTRAQKKRHWWSTSWYAQLHGCQQRDWERERESGQRCRRTVPLLGKTAPLLRSLETTLHRTPRATSKDENNTTN